MIKNVVVVDNENNIAIYKMSMIPELKQHGSHMIMTNVQKPPKIKILNIDTRFQEEYNKSPYASITYNLPQKITNVKSIYMTHIEIPYTFYNFSEAKGNTSFIISDDVSNDEYVFKIPDNNYTTTSLVLILNQVLSSTSLTNYITFSEVDKRLKIAVSSRKFTFYWNVSGVKKSLESDFDKTKFKGRLGWYLGLREPSYTISASKNITSESFICLCTTNYVFLVVDEFSSSYPNSFISPLSDSIMNKNILARIQIESFINSFGKMITATPLNIVSDKRIYNSTTDMYKLKIQLVDEWGTPLDLNFMDFSLSLKIEYE
jgi:hypothetical protein